MAYTVTISHDKLIEILAEHYDWEVYPNIKESDKITEVIINRYDLEIRIGED